MDSLSDIALMTKVKEGDLNKLGLLFERYNRKVFAYFYHLTADAQASEDLVQNTFYKILKNRKKFNGKGAFSSWMYSIARNNGFDYLKKNGASHHQDIDFWQDKLPDMSNVVDTISDQDDIDLLNKSLGMLPQDKREILVLSKYQGLKYKEIGEITGDSVGNVKVKVFRALKELKKIYCQLNINKDYDL
ncbi:RNA polymerase sigma factor [Flammeovirgaceae bacterium SG7u.111]|nr:RNA polymerase sigma factor [Flammeovirgaceae bacterium SG7u.132]WPO36955.1 RNA polymerase sigma factor [Flammeovirgaceae bacterium SG7u.111]